LEYAIVSNSLFKRRLAFVITVSLLFGAIMSIIKGNEDGIRNAFGNICAPWMLLPFLSNVYLKTYRIIQATLIGVVTSICALIGFYFTNSFVLDLGRDSWLAGVGLTLSSGLFYYKLGLFSGLFFGALGGLHGRYKTSIPAQLMAIIFVLEPFTWRFIGWENLNRYPIISVVETGIGIIAWIILVVHVKLSRRQ
jgi:hypothetical protein